MNDNLQERLTAIEKRNAKVEADKTWETSWTRRLAITGLTYMIVASYLLVTSNSKPWINAGIPAVGYMLSTLALGGVRSFWQSKN